VLPPGAAPPLVELLLVWLPLPLPPLVWLPCADACCGTMPMANTDAMTMDEIIIAYSAVVCLSNIVNRLYNHLIYNFLDSHILGHKSII
jgi:hypothetical protein